MSKCHLEKVTCPHCHQDFSFQMWDSINTMIDSDARRKLLHHELFTFECPSCGEKITVDYDTLFHQAEDRLMMYLVFKDPQVDSTIKSINAIRNDKLLGAGIGHYTYRIVRSQNQLIEKSIIFTHNMNDRAVELYKEQIVNTESQTDPAIKDAEIFLDFDNLQPSRFIVIYNNRNSRVIPYDAATYKSFAEKVSSIPEAPTEYCINSKWAHEHFDAYNSAPPLNRSGCAQLFGSVFLN